MADDKPDDLQFDRAEYAAAAPTASVCGSCGQNLWDVYYGVNGKPLCERCKTDVELERGQGSGIGRFLRASVFGTAAGAVGAGIWYAIRALTNFEFGLIAIVVGLMVGGAVKAGSRGRGGWRYQVLAVFLTYAAIASTYVPYIISGFKKSFEESQQAAPSARPDEAGAASASPAPATPAPAVATEPQPSLANGLLAVVLLAALILALAFAAPFLGGAQSILGLLIIGFGLWEAWKINRATPLEITGPHRVGAPPPVPSPGG